MIFAVVYSACTVDGYFRLLSERQPVNSAGTVVTNGGLKIGMKSTKAK